MADFNPLIQTYTIDFASNNNFLFIPTVQGDGYGSRYAILNLTNNGQPYNVPSDSVRVLIEGQKTDGTQILDYCEIMEDETSIKVNITPQMIASPGKNIFEIAIISLTENTVLTSFPLYIMASERAFDMEQAVSSDDYQVFIKYINDMDVTLNAVNEAEATRENQEAARQSNEAKRVSAENSRASAENTRKSNESSRSSSEATRIRAESARNTAETTRQENESVRISNEEEREEQEASRASAEEIRVTNENSRVSAETGRANAESSRVTSEGIRTTQETDRINAENARIQAENYRASAESNRVTAEILRTDEESSRQENETTRQNNEVNRIAAESARAASEENRTSSESSRQIAESERVQEWTELKEEITNATSSANQAATDIQTKASNGEFSASITSVEAITGEPGTEAIVENVGTKQSAQLLFTIPRGADGEDGTVDSSLPIEFTETEVRENIVSGETLSVLFGKISKFFSDMVPLAYSGSYNDLSDVPETQEYTGETYTEVGVITVDSNILSDLEITNHQKLHFMINYTNNDESMLSVLSVPVDLIDLSSPVTVSHVYHSGTEMVYLPITITSTSIGVNEMSSLSYVPSSVSVYFID